MTRRSAALIATALILIGGGQAHAAWNQPVPGSLNGVPTEDAGPPSLATISGSPVVAWAEQQGQTSTLRGLRLNSTGTAWEPFPSGGSVESNAFFYDPDLAVIDGRTYRAVSSFPEAGPSWRNIDVDRLNAAGTAWEGTPTAVNRQANQDGHTPDITGVSGIPYVAWAEGDGTNREIRVAHLNDAGTTWVLDADSASPINASSTANASTPSITEVNGRPWVAWQEIGAGGQSDIRVIRLNAARDAWVDRTIVDKVPAADAQSPSLTTIDGVPWIAWTEQQGGSYQIRVARFESGAWNRVADGVAPLNRDSNQHTNNPDLITIGGVPYVAWQEADGVGAEIRVARLNAAGTAWERIVDTDSPINADTTETALRPNLADVGGVPYVAWQESFTTTIVDDQIRVSRLEPEFVGQSVTPSSTTAMLSSTWRTYGVPFSIGFDYGTSLESSTTPTPAPPGQDTATVTQEISGLTPSSPYQARSFASPPLSAKLLASNSMAFQTTGGADATAPETTITKDPPNKLDKSKAKYKFTSSEPNSTFVCKVDKAKPKPCDAGKLKLKRLDDGKHKFKVYAVDAAGNEDSSPAKDKFKVL